MKNQAKGAVLPAQKLPPRKSIKLLVKETNILVLISICILLLVFVIFVVTLVSLIVLNNNTQGMGGQTQGNSGSQSVTIKRMISPTPTPIPLPNGPQSYSVSSRSSIVVKQLYISNLATKIGEPVTVKLDIQDLKSPVNFVSVKLVGDKLSLTQSLDLQSGTSSNGTWQGVFTTNDAHDYKYQAEITIKDVGGNVFSFTPSFR